MPSRQSFYNWLRGDPEFFDRSARARAIAALREMDEAERKLDEADDVTNVPLLRERLQHCRWKVSKLLPNTYGDKVALTGPGGGPLAVSRIEWVIVDPEESEE